MNVLTKFRLTNDLQDILGALDDLKTVNRHENGYLIPEKKIDDLRAAVLDALHELNK